MPTDPNQLAPGWTQNPDGTFTFSPTPEQQAGIKRPNGDVVRYGNDGQTYVDRAPHGFLDRIGQVAPYAILGGMAYGGLADTLGLPGGAASAGPGSYVADAVNGVQNGVYKGLGTVAPTVAAGAGGTLANAAGGSGGSILQKLLSPGGIASLAALIPSLMNLGGGGGQASQAQEALLNEALKRSQRVDPLHQAVTQLAFSRLPDSARQGIQLTGK